MKIQKMTAKALFIRNGKAFFVQDQAGNWELPGGCIEFGEKPAEALRREIKEELGITGFGIGDIIDVFDIQQVQHEGDEYQYIVVVYKCNADLENIKLSQEHKNLAWLGKDNLSNFPMRDGYKNITKSIC